MSDLYKQIASEAPKEPKTRINSVLTTELLGADGLPTASASGAVSIRFRVKGAGETILDLRKLSDSNRQRGMVHGLVQRVSDRAAKSRDTKTGLPVPSEEKLKAMAVLVEHLNSGSELWELRSAQAPRVDTRIENLLAALRSLGFAESSEGEAKVRGMTPAQRAAISLREDVAEKLRGIEALQAGEIDTDELLVGLE